MSKRNYKQFVYRGYTVYREGGMWRVDLSDLIGFIVGERFKTRIRAAIDDEIQRSEDRKQFIQHYGRKRSEP